MRLSEARKIVSEARTFLVGDRVIVVAGEYRGRTGRIWGKDWELVLYKLHAKPGEEPLPVELEPEPSKVRGVEPDWSKRRPVVTIRAKSLRRYGKSLPTGTGKLREARKAWRKADLDRKAKQNPRFQPYWLDDDHFVVPMPKNRAPGWPQVGDLVDHEDWIVRTDGRPTDGEWVADVGKGWYVVRADWRTE